MPAGTEYRIAIGNAPREETGGERVRLTGTIGVTAPAIHGFPGMSAWRGGSAKRWNGW